MLVCWRCVLSGDLDAVIDYYWYDLTLSVFKWDWLMIAHHVLSLYGLLQCEWHPDYEAIYLATIMLKSGDVLIHHYKITDALDWYDRYPVAIRFYQSMTIGATILLWMNYRVYRPIELYPWETNAFHYISVLFHCMNAFWIYKLTRLWLKTVAEGWRQFIITVD
jgi:hypothetical protein